MLLADDKISYMELNIEKLNPMLAAWNSSDGSVVCTLVEGAMDHNVHFIDPNHSIIGRDASRNPSPSIFRLHSSAIATTEPGSRRIWQNALAEWRQLAG